MQIADTTRFIVGLVLLAVGAALVWRTRGERGFGQHRQAAALCLLAAALFVAMGLGVRILR